MTKEIVICDDKAACSIKDYLEIEGYKACLYPLGIEFLGDIDTGLYYDLAIVDLSLPDISGYDVVRDLKSKYPNKPVIIWSCYAIEKKEADRVLYKPLRKAKDLVKVIEELTADKSKSL
jgi:DNA-binding response OmpR family regulator